MNVKLIAAAVGGIGWGALAGWALTADIYEQRLKDREELLEFYRNRPIGKITSVVETEDGMAAEGLLFDALERLNPEAGVSEPENPRRDETPEVDEAGETAEVQATDESQSIPEFDEEQLQEARSNLQHIIDQYTANPEDRDEFVNRASEDIDTKTPPYVIDRATYAWDEEGEHYQKTTVTYYPASRVVLDEDDEVVDDPGVVLGWRNLSRFGDESEDADTVFIRNRRLMTDFEVVRDEDSPLPLHVEYGLGREEFNSAKAAGTLRLRDEDQ